MSRKSSSPRSPTKSTPLRHWPKSKAGERDEDLFDRACEEDDINTIETLFPAAFDFIPTRALPSISSWDIYCKFMTLSPKSKVYKFLETQVIPDLNLDERGEIADIMINMKQDWTQIVRGYEMTINSYLNYYEDYIETFTFDKLIPQTSFGHWCSLDANGLSFPQACLQTEYYEFKGKKHNIGLIAFEMFDCFPFPTIDLLETINCKYSDWLWSVMVPDYITGKEDSTRQLIEDYERNRIEYDCEREYEEDRIIKSMVSNGKFELLRERFGKDGETLPMMLIVDDIIDRFNEKYGHHYNYNLQDSNGESLIFYNQRQSTIERTSKKEFKRYLKTRT